MLAACRARPADDLPRLVLADWLDEHGQPERAEFVRVQVELSHKSADVERTARLKAVEAELLEVWEPRWVSGYRRVCEDVPRDRRGFPAPRPKFVRGLIHIGNFVEALGKDAVRRWFRSPEAAWVEQVAFEYHSVDPFVKADIPDELCGRIALVLHLGADLDSDYWKGQLRLLAVSSNFTAVQHLSVTGVGADLVLGELARTEVGHLTGLTLSGGDANRTARLIAATPYSALSSLKLGPVTPAVLSALIRSPHLGNLTKLYLIGSPIGDAGILALCDSKLAHSLRSVKFPNTGMSDVGAVALARSPLLANMHGPCLNLMMNRIGDAGLEAVAGCQHLLRFRELVLRENYHPDVPGSGIGDAGVEALAASPYAANLQYLDFWRNRITDRGAFALSRSPYLNSVVDLSVKENRVTEAGAAALTERFGAAAKVHVG